MAALARQSWQDLAGCLDPNVQFRAVTPKGFRTADDRSAAAGYLAERHGQLAHVRCPRLHPSFRLVPGDVETWEKRWGTAQPRHAG